MHPVAADYSIGRMHFFGTPNFEPVTPVTRQLRGFSHRAALLIKFKKVFYSVTG